MRGHAEPIDLCGGIIIMRISSTVLATTVTAIAMMCTTPAALAQNNSISSNYLTGVWKEDAQCRGNEAMIFFPNGTMSSAGSVAANYTVSGPAQIVVYGPGGSATMGLQYINQDKLVLTIQNDATVLHRCGSNAGVTLSNAYITGGWGHNGNCATPEVFSANGHMRTSQGGQGTWALFGNTLRLTVNNGSSVDFAVQANGQRNMTLTQLNQGSNQISNYTRCF